MKVVIAGLYPLESGRIAGGPDAVVLQLSQALRRQGDVDVHVITLTDQVSSDVTLEQDGITVHAVHLRRLPRWTLLRVNARAIEGVIRAIDPDVVHAHNAGTYADAALGSGIPAVITVHGVIQQEARVYRRYGLSWRERLSWAYEEWYERWCLRKAQHVIAISPYVQQFYRDLTGARMYLVENPVAEPYFRLPATREPTTILCAARVIPRKNVLSLLQAFAQVRPQVPNASVRLAGETHSMPGYAEQCRHYVQEQGLADAVHFLGWLDERAVQAEYARCGCLALMSWQETAPVAVAQAMAAGRGVVASDVGGVRHMLRDGRAGLLVEPDDVDGQAAALRSMLQDQHLRDQLGAAARVEAERRFQSDAVAGATRIVYEQVIRSHG